MANNCFDLTLLLSRNLLVASLGKFRVNVRNAGQANFRKTMRVEEEIMEEQYNIRLLNIKDEILIKDLFVDVFINEPWNDDWSNEEQLNKYLEDIIDNKNSLSIGLFNNGELLGISLGSIIHWCSGTEYYIRELCIKSTHQHQGMGTLFLKLIEDYLHQKNISSIILSTDIGTPAYDFYTKNNFNELPKSRFFHKNIQ